MTGVRRETWLPAEPSSASAARRVVLAALEETSLDPGEIYDVVLATSEAVANAIEHGSPCAGRGVRLRLLVEPERVAVEVSDCGHFPSGPPGDDPDRGRGLPIIGAVCDVVELVPTPGQTTIRFAKRCARAGERAAAAA